MVWSTAYTYELEYEVEGYGFIWKVTTNSKRKDSSGKLLDIKVGRVKGPYCKNDYREMKVSRTYWGRYKYKYKYKYPKCGNEKTLFKNL